MNVIKKIWENRWVLRSLHKTIFFNFHYLPFKQAIRLPILLYKPKLLKCKGHVSFDSSVKIKTGIVRWGFYDVSIYPNSGITYENNGGNILFRGRCVIGNHSFISLGTNSSVEFGEYFVSTAGLKLVSYSSIKFGIKTSIGWNCLIMDTNFHPLYDMISHRFKQECGSIEIGDYNWFAADCKIMHSVKTPERCIFGMGSIVTRNCQMKSYCLMGGSPVKILTENVMRDFDNEYKSSISN